MRVFLAQPDEGLPNELVDAVVEAVRETKHELLPELPEFHAGVSPSERNRFLTVLDRMMEAELLVADVSRPDHTIGWCVAWFLARGRLVVLACRRDGRGTLSPMIAGNPSPWQRLVLYDAPEDLRNSLVRTLAF